MHSSEEENSTVFGSSKIRVEKIDGSLEYNSVFGSQVIDFREHSIRDVNFLECYICKL